MLVLGAQLGLFFGMVCQLAQPGEGEEAAPRSFSFAWKCMPTAIDLEIYKFFGFVLPKSPIYSCNHQHCRGDARAIVLDNRLRDHPQ